MVLTTVIPLSALKGYSTTPQLTFQIKLQIVLIISTALTPKLRYDSLYLAAKELDVE